MSARFRGLAKDGVIPTDPKWVAIEASDGDARRWPMNTTPNPDAEGHVNYMQPLSIDNGQAIKWRLVVGQALAEMLHYNDLDSKKWVLKDWPVGYQFYDHNKGQKDGNVRHDLYLVGSDTVARFRSPQEFIPHAYWLMTDPTRDRSNCACKYCARKPQREISDAFGLSQRQSGGPSIARFTDIPRNRDRRRSALPAREGRVFATVRRAPKPISLPKGPKQHVNPEREKDLRAILGPKTLGERRWAREGELVWVKLDYPVPVDDRDVASEKIMFWPGIIDEVHFKAEITSRRAQDASTMNGSATGLEMGATSGSKGAKDEDPWSIVHKSIYKIKLLVASKTVIYGTDHILPYQSHAPDDLLLTYVQSYVFDLDSPTDELDGMVLPSGNPEDEQTERVQQALFKRFESFDPFPETVPLLTQVEGRRRYFETAAGAFAVAIQIASRLTMYWTPSDAWEYKMQIPLTSRDSSDVWSTSQEPLSSAERHALSQRILGTGMHASQTRFQGLWWGPERIWMGDLVRLKLARYQVAPEGTEMVKKPSGPGMQGLLEAERDNPERPLSSNSEDVDFMMHDDIFVPNGDPSINGICMRMKNGDSVHAHDLGAASRTLFLRIDGLFVVQVSSEDGKSLQNECRMCGMLYEVADEDWEPDGEEFGDPLPPKEDHTNQHSPDTSKGSLATPLRTVMQNKTGSTLADIINESTSRQGPLPSSSLFTPNPELLSEPPLQTDVAMAEISQNDADPFVSANPLVTLPLASSAIPPSTFANGQDMTGDITPPKAEPSAPSNSSLSGPLKSAESVYPTPPPPSSMKFRPILRDGYEVVMPLTTLAGRYYPALLSNALLRSRVQAALENPEARGGKAIQALEGFVPGAYNSVDATRFLPRRGQMLREAEGIAWQELVNYWKRQKKDAIVIDDD